MSKKGMIVVVVLGALMCGALAINAAVNGSSADSSGLMGEVLVSAHAPAMMLEEVVVRPLGPDNGLMPEVVVTAAGPRVLAAASSVVPAELN